MNTKRINKWTMSALVLLSLLSSWMQPASEVQRADGFTILFVAAIAISIAAGYLLQKKVDAQARDQRLPTTSQRGDQLAYVLGRRIVPGQPMWVGRRGSREEQVSGGGKGGGIFGGGPKQIIYYEDAVHAILLGPASHLFQIIKNQSNVVFSGPITPDSTPSGSLLHDNEGNAFKIYWGERFQPINTDLAGDDALGIASRWPYWCYIHWIQYRCGPSATWPQLDYDMAATCVGSTLPGSICNFPESAPGALDAGINGAHAIYQLTTAAFPHGVKFPVTKMDFGTLKALGVSIQTERIPQNILIAAGTTLPDIMDDILGDLGCFIAQEGDKLLFMPIRPVSNPPVLNDSIQVMPRPSLDVSQGSEQASATVFLYPDILNQYTLTDVQGNDDATSQFYARKKGQQVTLATITDQTTAAVVSQRRKLLYLADANQLSVEVIRTARRLVVGQVVILSGVGQIRVTGMERLSQSSKAKLTASLDQYSLSAGGWDPNTGPGSGGPTTPTPDDAFYVFELPHEMVGRSLRIGVVRIRKDGQGVPAAVWVSTDGTTYTAVASQNGSAAGFVVPQIDQDTPRFMGQGPIATATTAAASKVADLTSDQAGWLSGSQLLVFPDETMFLRSITAAGGGYRLNGIIRERLCTQRHLHGAGTLAGVISPDSITSIGANSWGVGVTLYVKCQPLGIDLDDVVPVTLKLTGKALGGPPVGNFGPATRPLSSDVNLTWSSRVNVGSGAGAGEMPYGEPVTDTTPPMEGFFLIEILNTGGILKRTANSTSEGYTYSAADQATDGINNDPFTLRVTHFIDNYGGYPVSYAVPGAT